MGEGSASENELNATTFQTYVYLIKTGKPVGPRDVMRGANLSSPSVAYRNLQKLIDLGLVVKDAHSNYIVKEKISVKGYVWWGKNLIPRFLIFGFIFIGVLTAEIAVIVPHIIIGDPIERSLWLLTALTVVTATIFLVEGLRWRQKGTNKNNP
ncbi:MAG: hypothetical protein NWF05_03295 [Candidatus Bathyarchaeota archaeon]|nr:hypothetical protein [Candidatus Bathyarchaeota archaeon]